ncbi:TnsD family Tn7-like transposition protein [Shewanella sp.]|uniref:TnsD family Tn7-like transposition protein n=1 Tax=Shewanella sp. TaxID=50422 RepID=UPI003A9791EE
MQLPRALPDETLFSRIVRSLSSSGIIKEQFLSALVGNRRAVIHPYLSANLTAISRSTSESAPELLCNQTLRPLFSHYLPRYQHLICDCSISLNELIRACQLSKFRECEPLTVKYCPLCANDDLHNTGVAYWHCIHQIPGVDVCAVHGVWLSHNGFKGREHINSNFLPTPGRHQEKCEPLAIKFAEFAERKLRSIQTHSLHNRDSMQYKPLLAQKGFVTTTSRVKRIQLMNALYDLSEKILLSNNPLRITSNKDFRYIESLLNGSFHVHPFKHLLIEFFLTHEHSFEYLQTKDSPSELKSRDACEAEARCCALLQYGVSMIQVSREIGKSRCYVKAVALKHGVPVNLKPKKITDIVKERIIDMAYKGFHRSEIARKLGISSGSVELIISITTGLVEWRKKCKSDSLKRRYQCQILRYCQHHFNSSRQDVRQSCEAAFFWLYFHHPSWLDQHLPEPKKTQHVDRVNWDERDSELSKLVTSILSKIDHKVSRTELDRMLGSHGWLTSRKDKLPLTVEAYYKYYESKKTSRP